MKAKQPRVLLVDDNPADRLIYRMALLSHPGVAFQVFEAEHGQAGLDSCKEHLPDCILLDFNLPDMDGLRFLSRLKEQYGDMPCAVIMLTGVRDESVAVRAMKSGTTDYLPKTENVGEILAHAVVDAIEKSRMRRQIAEQQLALEASELRYRTLVESLPQLVWLADSAGNVQFGNRRWFDYTGVTSFVGFDLQEAMPAEDRERFSNVWDEAAVGNRAFEIELRLRRSCDAAERWHLVRFTPTQDRSGEPGWLGTAMDIEDVKQAEATIQTKQKWESIGLLAGGIAHDFNNLLVGILGGASLLMENVPAADDNHSTLKMIVQSSERAAYLTRQLLAYSGKGQFCVQSLDLSEVVRKTCGLVRSSIPPRLRLSIETTDPMPIVEADTGQIQQVITNLVMNAAEAIPENQRGTVTVRTLVADGRECRSQDYSGPDGQASGTYAVLEVQDTGTGMDAETRAKIFDPFFTTKFLGRGLGLAAVQGIVRSAEGQIDVNSAPGKGSIVRVFLPTSRRRETTERPPAVVQVAPHENLARTVLIIDDEPGVRQMMRSALKRAGYEVLTAKDGPTGLSVLEQQRDSVSLILLDVGMPEMGGEEVLRRIRASGCQVPVVICSGYAESEVLSQIARCEFSAFIQKPFGTNELARCVNTLLRDAPVRK